MFALAIVATGDRLDERTWENGGDAAAEAQRINAESDRTGSDLRVRVVKIERQYSEDEVRAWKRREREKQLRHGSLPWAWESWYTAEMREHYAHPSAEDPGKLAYTPDDSWGVDDRQLRTRVGKYLSQFTDLPDHVIATWVAKWDERFAPRELHITQDADRIQWVYVNGPGSCMSGNGWAIHPARVYAGPDLGLAYMLNDAGEPSGRCVVWPERKLYGTIYGDYDRMVMALENDGYSCGSMRGARLQLIRDGSNIVMPYVDGCYHAYIDGQYVRLCDEDEGDICCDSTEGYGYQHEPCARCDRNASHDYTILHNGDRYCYDCSYDYAASCECCDETYPYDETHETPSGYGRMCDSCHAEEVSECADCGNEKYNDDLTLDGKGDSICDDCAHGCNECGEVWTADDMAEDGLCVECAQHKLPLEENDGGSHDEAA